MSIGEGLLPEFDQEMSATRRTLERVPVEKFAWKPHEKSMALGELAIFVAILSGWAKIIIEQDSFDVAPPRGTYQRPVVNSQRDLLELFDKNVSAARACIAQVSDEHLLKPWTMLADGRAVLTQPRMAVLRGGMMNHLIHHRAQLGVYLRLNNIPVPAIYGPSADESVM
jgi:uncharacterized damage-inducible protein DinB